MRGGELGDGKWHGDVIIHMFNTSKPESKIDYLNNVSALMNIRHENIVSFVGWTPMYYDKMGIIIGLNVYQSAVTTFSNIPWRY